MVFNVEDTAARLRGTRKRIMGSLDFEARAGRQMGGLDFEAEADVATANAVKTRKRRFKFPLANENDYKAYILFQPIITTPPELGDSMKAFGEMFKSLADLTMRAATGVTPTEAPVAENSGQENFQSTTNNIMSNEKKELGKDSCKMYMPSNITFQDGVNYSTADLGFAGGAASAAISNGGGLLEGLASGGLSSLDNFYQALKGSVSQDAARLGATRLAGVAGKNGAIDGAVRGSLRTSPISNMTMLFDKPNLRTFSFSFKMQPVSKEEAFEIVQIVKFFRTELYPEAFNTDTLGGISVPFGYRFPNEIQISMHYGDRGNNRNFIKFKPCYLTNFQATFNAPSGSFFKGGDWQETTISMTLRENELLNKDDIRKGY